MVYVLMVNGSTAAVYSTIAAARSDKKRLEDKIQNLVIMAVPYRTHAVLD
ncbi:hypothetical protein RA086_05470 [Lactiplantibacillus sp. WILCCON 0030]|uniref:Uncharacterized protein n=1 Tax=Lactiplantibacillus brownii TaxID=3069269 RepID=A0ABU1A820_9LACO|nr:hypothetical protein [Lactiplantibacillus brownii]MDQ7937076.1 hypothetical protein [Lactiplantibacillus brownii]